MGAKKEMEQSHLSTSIWLLSSSHVFTTFLETQNHDEELPTESRSFNNLLISIILHAFYNHQRDSFHLYQRLGLHLC